MRRLFRAATLTSVVLLAPVMALADNQEIADHIKTNLSGNLKNYVIGIKVEDGTAWLNGTVANQDQMVRALSIAQRTEGVDRVVNNLSIGAPQSGGRLASGLRQPGAIAAQAGNGDGKMASGQNSMRRNGVVQAGMMDIPDHAKEQLGVAGPAPKMDDDTPAAMPSASGQAGQPMPLPVSAARHVPYTQVAMQNGMPVNPGNPPAPGAEMIGTPRPLPAYVPTGPGAVAPYHFDHPQMPGYAWPSYAAYPNYAAVTYPKQYSPTAWPYIGPFYPYPQVPLGWRKVTLEWEDGWWFLDFKDSH
ncbi:MAG TPA: BON domain-containing protein [Pirellulales bacterium]|nr:BON domain-containing protein [Pirellulales bacterium]